MIIRKGLTASLVLMMSVSLASCKSAKDQAEDHYQRAQELILAGDPDRAVVEFRNVFKLDEQHHDARLAFAALQEERGNVAEAYAQYLRVAEKSPDDLAALKPMARIAADSGDWKSVRKYGGHALELDPEDPSLKAAMLGADYAQAIENKDEDARQKLAAQATAMIDTQPQSLLLWRIAIDSDLREMRYSDASAALEKAIEIAPDNKEFHLKRLSVLATEGKDQEVETGLLRMIEQFPGDQAVEQTLLRWYVSHDQLDKAEAYLRDQIKPDSGTEPRISLLAFLKQTKGSDAAFAELEQMIADGRNDPVLLAMRAGLKFERGNHEDAITEMQAIVDAGDESDQTRTFKVALAQMHQKEGDQVTARALIEEVLAKDEGQVDALKMKAAWLIQDDKSDTAISLLRTALDQNPQDTSIMTLLAEAYQHNGDTDLMASMLSLAVEASNKAPTETLRYADYLAKSGKLKPAEGVLIDSLRLNADNVGLLRQLGAIYVQMEDWGRLQSVLDKLAKIDGQEAQQSEKALRLAMLRGQNNTQEVLGYLNDLAQQPNGGTDAKIEILRTYLSGGDMEKARSYVDGLLQDDPENATYRFMKGAVLAAAGDLAGAETEYRGLVAQNPSRTKVWVALYGLLNGDGRPEDANALLSEALDTNPDDPSLLWLKAGSLEKDNDIDGAIAIYETLYSRDTGNAVIANNLASLLASYRTDAESLDRAYAVARRLQGTTFPPFQDTYGWIIYLHGEKENALTYLEPAAAALTTDPVTQFHLAQNYEALDRPADALAQYRKVLSLVGELDTRDFVKTSSAAIKKLEQATK